MSDGFGVLDAMRIANVVMLCVSLAMMWMLRHWFSRQSEPVRLTLIGVGVLLIVSIIATIEAILIDAKPASRVPLLSLAYLLITVGLVQTWRRGRHR